MSDSMATKRRLGEGRTLLADEYGVFFVSTINKAAPMSGERLSQEAFRNRVHGYGGVVYETMVFCARRDGLPKAVFQRQAASIQSAVENHEDAVQFLEREYGIDRSTGIRSGEE